MYHELEFTPWKISFVEWLMEKQSVLHRNEYFPILVMECHLTIVNYKLKYQMEIVCIFREWRQQTHVHHWIISLDVNIHSSISYIFSMLHSLWMPTYNQPKRMKMINENNPKQRQIVAECTFHLNKTWNTPTIILLRVRVFRVSLWQKAEKCA